MSAIKAAGNCRSLSMCVYAVVFVALSAGSGMLFAVLVRCTRALPLPLLPLTHRVLARVFGRCICLTTLIAFVCAVTNSVCFVCAQLISPMASSRLTTTPRFLRRRYQVIFCHSRIPLYSLFLFRFHSRFDFAREMCILSCPPPFLKRDECEWVGGCVCEWAAKICLRHTSCG